MLINIKRSFHLYHELSYLRMAKDNRPYFLAGSYLCTLILFLILYIGVEVFLCLPGVPVNGLLISFLLLLGSVFILLSTPLQLSLSKKLHTTNMEITQALISAVEARDENLNGHSLHVAKLSHLIYTALPASMRRGFSATALGPHFCTISGSWEYLNLF